MALPRLWSLFCVGLLCAPVVHAQTNSVTISRSGDQIRLSVHNPTPLSNVVQVLCEGVQAACSGADKGSTVTLPPEEFSGNWQRVVSSLLEGTGLNYVSTAPSEHSGATLDIVGLAVAVPNSPPPSVDQAAIREFQAKQSRATPDLTATAEPSPITTPPEPQAAAASTNGDDAEDASSNLFFGAQDPSISSSATLLFPDSNGNPMPASNRPAKVLPFPDSSGNPIPVTNPPQMYLLFPDSQGRPIPVSNQPAQYLLFPDSAGNPIPVHAPQP